MRTLTSFIVWFLFLSIASSNSAQASDNPRPHSGQPINGSSVTGVRSALGAAFGSANKGSALPLQGSSSWGPGSVLGPNRDAIRPKGNCSRSKRTVSALCGGRDGVNFDYQIP